MIRYEDSSRRVIHYTYDDHGNCTSIRYPSLRKKAPEKTVTYTYDAVLYNIDPYNLALLQKYTGTRQYSLSRSSAQNPFADGMVQEPIMKSILYNGTLHSVEIYNEERLADVMSRYSEGSRYLYIEGRTWGPIMDGLLMTAVSLGDYGKNAYQQNQIVQKPLRDSNQNLSFEIDLQLFAKKRDIKQIEQVAKKFKMSPVQRREFGDYVESEKEGGRNDKNFSFHELLELAKEFLGEE